MGLWFGWPMGSPDGEENVRRGRHHRDLRPLVRGPLEERVGRVAGVDRKTIRKYLEPAEASGITSGGPPMREADWAKLIKSWFPELADRRLRQITWPEIDQHRDYIKDLLGTVTVSTIHQRLRDEHKLDVSISSFRRWVHATLPDETARSQVTVLRDDVEPGSEAQIDYGHLGLWTNPKTGKRHRIWAFVMVLPCSRHMFVRPILYLHQHAWTEAHVAAFRYFGGVPRRLVPDNLRTGVDKPDLYDPKINKAYAELATHYGALVDPARAARPKDKPRVERPMPYIVRDHRSRDPAAAAAHPVRPGPLVNGGGRTGHPHQSRPHPLLGALETDRPPVDVRSTATMVQVFLDGALVKTHVALDQGKRTDRTDYPPEKIAFQMRTPIWCRTQASDVGDSCRTVVDQLLEVNALYRLRAAQGILGLKKKYGDARLEAACARAITVGDPSYRTIKGILIAGTEADPEPESSGDVGAAAFLHGPQRLFASVAPSETADELLDDQVHGEVEGSR